MTTTPITAASTAVAAVTSRDLTALLEANVSEQPLPGVTRVIRMTPDLAQALLELHERSGFKNRPTDRKQVENLKREIAEGRWMLTPQGINLGRNGAIVDGKHRLTAIAEGQFAVSILVWSDVPHDLFSKLDSVVRARSGADWVGILGISDTHKATISSGYRLLAAYERNTTVSNSRLAPDDLDDMYLRHPDLVENVTEAKRLQRSTRMPDSAAVVAIYLVKNYVPGMDMRAFMEGVCEGVGLTADDPRLHLRKWFDKFGSVDKRTRASRGLMDPAECLRVFLLAAVDYRNGQRYARFRHTTRTVPLLLPSHNSALIAS